MLIGRKPFEMHAETYLVSYLAPGVDYNAQKDRRYGQASNSLLFQVVHAVMSAADELGWVSGGTEGTHVRGQS